MQAIAEHSRIVRLPLNQVGSLNKLNKAFSKLEQQFEREPTEEELAQQLDLAEDKVKDSIQISGRHISMDAPLVSGEESTLYDVMVNSDSPKADRDLLKESLQMEIERTLDTLSEREKEIIKLYFGIGMNHGLTIDEIGEKFDLTRERVRQIKEKALKRLRQSTRSRLLRSYLG